MSSYECSFASMGTSWRVVVWDDIPEPTFRALEQTIRAYCSIFDHTYSRFIEHSLVNALAQSSGTHEVPQEFVEILKLYQQFFLASHKLVTPLVGATLSDMGYDAAYTLKPKKVIRRVPDFLASVQIIDNRHIVLNENTLIDIGAIGKGFAVDAITHILEQKKIEHYLVDGSGDIRYKGPEAITIGLEHPKDASKVIGSVAFISGAMCSSATNRRAWNGSHHIINPLTNKSADTIIASWVIAESAAIADGLATALFLCSPENFFDHFSFEYLLLNSEMKVKRSQGFTAELY
ncbi:MAG: Thiamine biosynthesis lipoprotein ApbE precursor [Microgenomates bacterium OLB23]|nr:MAG: Thiamine biosynthesis lipoprotein ApbE precursor [Microgenomates bacterium OLB23]